ncbi:MAG: hypothetical protein IJL97_04060, partial [Lachnospiraceae bacterium]|nr:hypothetical protein [Lachnospiraceae bacterium]
FDEVVTADNAIWVSEYSGDTYVPFTGTIEGEKTYSAYASLKAAEGYRFSNDIEVYFGEPASGEVISKNDKEIVIAVSIAAVHDIDWDTYESTSATCISPGSESYTCTGCGKHIVNEEPIDPRAHVWGEWETVKEASHLETGLKSHTCTLCNTEGTMVIPRLYTKVYEPDTSWPMAATIAWRADGTAADVSKADVRPGVAFIWVDSELKVYDRDENVLSDNIEEYVKTTADGMIPAFYIKDEAAAEALKGWLTETGFEDCFVVSTPDNKDFVKDIADLLHVRGMLDFSEEKEPDRKAFAQMVSAVNGAHGKVVIINEEAASYENVRLLQSLCASVWVKADTPDTKTLVTLYTHGVNGVVVDDFEAAVKAEELFKDDAPSLLRVPFIIGHRGDPSNYPENTIESARGAFEEGANMIENDIQISTDGELFIRHDNSLFAFIGIKKDPETCTLEELKSYVFDWDSEDYGLPYVNEVSKYDEAYGILFDGKLYGEAEKKEYRTPTLREYLEEFKDKCVVHTVEIKSRKPELIDAYKQLVDECDAWDQVFTITFEDTMLDILYEKYPEISVGFLAPVMFEDDYPYYSYYDIENNEGAEVALEKLCSVLDRWNATYNPLNIFYSEEMVKAARHRGITTWSWTYVPFVSESMFAHDYLIALTGLTTDAPWQTSGLIVRISSEDAEVTSLDEVEKPQGTTQAGETAVLDKAELIELEDLDDEGTEKLVIWRYKAELMLNDESCGEYYLYSDPFTVTLKAP